VKYLNSLVYILIVPVRKLEVHDAAVWFVDAVLGGVNGVLHVGVEVIQLWIDALDRQLATTAKSEPRGLEEYK
jgi:hypothetical protein